MGGVTHLGCAQWVLVVVVSGGSGAGRRWVVVVKEKASDVTVE